MKKRILALAAAGACCLAMTACGPKAATVETTSETAAAAETAGTETETETETETTVYYAYDYDLESLVTLGEYKGLTYTIADTNVTDEEVEEEINYTLASYAEPEQITDRAAEDGDTVVIDFVGKKDGEAFDGGTAEGYALTLGSDSFIEGFEDGLIGVMPGDSVSLDLTFPEDYQNEELAGQAVTFDVTLNYIEGEDITPELNDEFVVSLGLDEAKTVDEYREYVRGQLQETKETEAESNKRSELVEKAVENAQVSECPAELVEQYKTEYVSYYEQYAQYFGMEMEEFLASYMNSMTVDDLYAEAQDYGEDAAKHMLVICAIAKAEGLDNIEDAEYTEKLEKYAEDNGFDSAEAIEEAYGEDYLKQVIINERVFDLLEENAKGVEASETEASETEAAETETSGE